MSTTMTETAPMITTKVPVVAGDVSRTTNFPAVPPPSTSPSALSSNDTAVKKGHRRSSSVASDLSKAVGIEDLRAVKITPADARKIMSEEHRILGFRPPQGSFAAELQSVASKHPESEAGVTIDTAKLKEIARQDALRILSERSSSIGSDKASDKDEFLNGLKPANTNVKHIAPARSSPPLPTGVNLDTISADDARTLMSHEHRALGFRPPPGSIAAEAQSAAARHPEGDGKHLDEETLRDIALRDAERIKADRELNMIGTVNVSTIGKEGAAAIVSAEARALGHRPPAGSLAAEAQSAGDKHPNGGSFNPATNPVELEALKDAAREEGQPLREQEQHPVNNAKLQIVNGANPTVSKVDKAVETEPMTEAPVAAMRSLTTPPLERSETTDSVEIIGDVLC